MIADPFNERSTSIASRLQDHGCEVFHASTLADAMAVSSDVRPSFILTELKFPDGQACNSSGGRRRRCPRQERSFTPGLPIFPSQLPRPRPAPPISSPSQRTTSSWPASFFMDRETSPKIARLRNRADFARNISNRLCASAGRTSRWPRADCTSIDAPCSGCSNATRRAVCLRP